MPVTGKQYCPVSLALAGFKWPRYKREKKSARDTIARQTRAKQKFARVCDACRLYLSLPMTLSAGVVHGIDNRSFYRHVVPLASVRWRFFV